MYCSAFHLLCHLISEQENELNISKEREEKLRIQNSSLSGEYERLNCTYSVRLPFLQKATSCMVTVAIHHFMNLRPRHVCDVTCNCSYFKAQQSFQNTEVASFELMTCFHLAGTKNIQATTTNKPRDSQR